MNLGAGLMRVPTLVVVLLAPAAHCHRSGAVPTVPASMHHYRCGTTGIVALTSTGADAFCFDSWRGMSAADIADQEGHAEMAEMLLQRGRSRR